MNDSEFIMLRNIEKNMNNRLIDRVIGGSYLGDYRPKIFAKLKKIGLEAYAHILAQLEKFNTWYKN